MTPSRRGLLIRLVLFAGAYGFCAWMYLYARTAAAFDRVDDRASFGFLDGECEERLKELSWQLHACCFSDPSTPVTSLEAVLARQCMHDDTIPELLHCPCDSSKNASSYELVSADVADGTPASRRVEIRERSPNHLGMRNLIYADGSLG